MESEPASRPSASQRLLRWYGWGCVVIAPFGIGAAVYFFAAGDAFIGWLLVVMTLLLIPAFLGFRYALQRHPF
ncbi:hypothetical protein E4P40_09805 [Blastococcus sp. CT_GayMR20]|uniref:hypothetical protein n=1 Tax=Blastococcus sp. CT_GayMR20 TaxID=2559609 RepID=UPI001073993A|nr:hypothetical protein [Blastococcus sp. CT_GayMR20]TFV88444.1 hypothetical protein E4P40_09805 [Blastococcus sp. CT_GayMR20]